MELQRPDAAPLETFLRTQLKESETPHQREQFWTLPAYLKDLLRVCSLEFASNPDRYDVLIDEALKVPNPMIVSLNYDTLL